MSTDWQGMYYEAKAERDDARRALQAAREALEAIGGTYQADYAQRCKGCNKLVQLCEHTYCPGGIARRALAALGSGTPPCPSHCSFPDTGKVEFCPCDPGDCKRCDDARAATPPPPLGRSGRHREDLPGPEAPELCRPGCGTNALEGSHWRRDGGQEYFCTEACLKAGRALNPATPAAPPVDEWTQGILNRDRPAAPMCETCGGNRRVEGEDQGYSGSTPCPDCATPTPTEEPR